MKFIKTTKILKFFLINSTILLLYGCSYNGILNAQGTIANQQYELLITVFLIMLLIVIPVIIMTLLFSFLYRSSRKNVNYDPNWNHSKPVEIIVWTVPIIIVFFLAIITWQSTHNLDPKKNVFLEKHKNPIYINVVSLDWKWFFIYPQYNIATINEISIPINVPIIFKITSNSNMNSFFIPSLGSQIYAMAGMKTTLHLISNKTGVFKGISANYSGEGFSGMKFSVISSKNTKCFMKWINKVKNSKKHINNFHDFKKISVPSQNHNIEYFSSVYSKIFTDIINQFYP